MWESVQPPAPGSRTIAGYALRWGVPSSVLPDFDEVFELGALTWPNDLTICINHDRGQVIGQVGCGSARINTDRVGLWVELDPTDYDVVAAVRTGVYTAWSVSFLASQDEWRRDGVRPLRIVRQARLLEVSLCDRGAHSTTVGLGNKPDMWLDNRRQFEAPSNGRRTIEF